MILIREPMAEIARIELTPRVPKTLVLPLHQISILKCLLCSLMRASVVNTLTGFQVIDFK